MIRRIFFPCRCANYLAPNYHSAIIINIKPIGIDTNVLNELVIVFDIITVERKANDSI